MEVLITDTEQKIKLGNTVTLSPQKIEELKERGAYKRLPSAEDGSAIIDGILKEELENDGFKMELPGGKILFVRKGDFEKKQ
jgi:hypothetical protein